MNPSMVVRDEAVESEAERAVLDMVRENLRKARRDKSTGTLSCRILLKDGGVTEKYIGGEFRVR